MQVLEYTWEESMRTGDEVCDAQHKELIHRLNLLLHAMYKGQPALQVESMLDFLASYVVQHFSREETLMDQVHCPLASVNRKAHAEFLRRFGILREQPVSKESTAALVAVKMLRDLSEWLVQHIRSIDARMLPYVEAAEGKSVG